MNSKIIKSNIKKILGDKSIKKAVKIKKSEICSFFTIFNCFIWTDFWNQLQDRLQDFETFLTNEAEPKLSIF